MYHYEALGDERFQEFCQALISATFPNSQCLPVGQPDGGRDAFWFRRLESQLGHTAQRDLVVFQVKYAKNSEDGRTERQMIEEVVKKEINKIEKLKSMGLTKYYLITNIKGTAHFGAGSIDRVNSILSEAVGVDAYCWWRDDLDRRLDGVSSIKWSYPDILKATDLLEKLVAGQLGEDEERRRSAIRAYLVGQYEDDQELKFKQTDLRSTMADLFVDLSMRPTSEFAEGSRLLASGHRVISYRQLALANREVMVDYDSGGVDAAEYLTKTPKHSNLSRVILEGAPGQGKSTVTQFVCQILRMQLLGKQSELQALPLRYRNTQARIPFRVDLRDLAKWIAGVDPFQSKPHPLDEREPKSLEGFLAGQVRFVSGGHTFNVSDLTAVAKASNLLLALDGFDEVADINLRRRLVDEITKGASRLINAGGFSVQTIVTSRPAAFAKSVRFPRDQWTYFELQPLERRQIDEYTSKWTKAKGLKEGEEAQLRSILDIKLKEAHTQYLAKNPMQLTILLSLINSRGASLPEKRTTMYDAYMDMFFSRESEKSEVVRDNRDILIDIHRFLAWKLQTAAESGENGSIEHGALRAMLFSYLDRENENTAIVDSLFNGIIERVGALVSRVQDTYEFEVQPLREYFAARYLYETAPYPSDDQSSSGDKFDRFKALVGNPYWMNVARFYGGCFNKGEILTLVNEITELSRTQPYEKTSHPRSVALMLLGDWVFTQYQPAVKQIVAFITEYPKLRQLLANAEYTPPSLWSGLSERSGRNDFLNNLWSRLVNTKLIDEQRALANAIVQNSSFEEIAERWEGISEKLPHADWVRIGGNLKVFYSNAVSDLKSLQGTLTDEIVVQLMLARQFDFLSEPSRLLQAQSIMLEKFRMVNFLGDTNSGGSIGFLAKVVNIYQYSMVFFDDSGLPLRASIEQRFSLENSREAAPDDHLRLEMLSDAERLVLEAYNAFMDTPTTTLNSSIEPWADLVERLRSAWGDCPAIDRIAFIGAGIRSKHSSGVGSSLAHATNLVAAARYIRLKSGAPRWWEDRLQSETSPSERRRLLLLLLRWGSLKTLLKTIERIDETLQFLSDADWRSLVHDFKCMQFGDGESSLDIGSREFMSLKKLSSRAMMFVGLRLASRARFELGLAIAASNVQAHSPESQFALQSLIAVGRETAKWKVALPWIQKLYLKGTAVLGHVAREPMMAPSIAAQISLHPEKFPLSLVYLADTQLLSTVGAKAPKLLEVARAERWFAG
ncbi:NACHT domain-containing protein [Mesorhizobium sp. M7A.T.Ca.TU.009.01.3.2]|nr:NACHT domain-containing protein [Mesorhizobium sp. M7A.T.Ca.TU.009.01.3.2]RUV12661.1 NACHT domain-containing protein [Mesorhizobium sp. M7A.T.Ca.TU.009.01.3.1]